MKIKLIIFFAIFSFFELAYAQRFLSLQTVVVRNTSTEGSYFDSKSLEEIIAGTVGDPAPDSLETTIQKLEDYFSSAPIAVTSSGGLTVLTDGFRFNVDKFPDHFYQKYPVFPMLTPITPQFALAYAKFLSNSTKDLIPVLNELIKTIDASVWVQEHFTFFYVCLRTLAITSNKNQRVQNCLDESIANFKLKNTVQFVRLANIYLKLYRASRILFESISELDPNTYKRTVTYDPINVDAPEMIAACKTANETFAGISQTKHRIRKESLERMPGGLWSSITWNLYGQDQTTQGYNLIFATPDLNSISGAYFRVKWDTKSRWSDYSFLCGEYW